MRVEDLRYFEHLSKVLNYTRASKDLHISQPTLSPAVKRLEDRMGCATARTQSRNSGAY